MIDEFEVPWKDGGILVDRFYDTKRRVHYHVSGWKGHGSENYDAVRKKNLKGCRRFLRGRDVRSIDGRLLGDSVLGERIHFREDL